MRRQCDWLPALAAAAATTLGLTTALAQTGPSATEIPTGFSDAPAVVIEHEISWDIWPRKSSTHVKKRVLVRADTGKEEADQSVYYVSSVSALRSFTARTLRADGSTVVVPEELRHDLVAYRAGDFEVRVVLFTFPAVEVGSILEWEYEIGFDHKRYLEWWEVQESIPVLSAGFEVRFHKVDAPLRVRPWSRIPFDDWCDREPAEIQGKTPACRHTCRNVPAFEPEPASPPENESRVRLLMAWGPASVTEAGTLLLRSAGDRWRERIQRLARKRGEVESLVARLRSGAESDTQLVDLVYGWVKENLDVREVSIGDDLEKGRGESASVAEILERGGGSPNEVAIATLTILREAGIEARPVLVGDRLRERVDWGLPDLPTGLHVLLEVVTDGKTGYLDPGCDLCMPGIPDWRYCAGAKSGIRVNLDSGVVFAADVPPIRSLLNSERYRDEIELGVDGLSTVAGSVRWFGQHDVTVRRIWEDLTVRGREDFLRNRIAGDIEALQARSSDPAEFRETLLAEYDYKRRDMALLVGNRLLVAAPDVFTPNLQLPLQEKRRLPLWWTYPYSIIQEAIFTLPDGFEIGDLPDAIRLAGPGLTFQGRWVKEADTGHLRWEARLQHERISLGSAEYPEARRFATDLFRALGGGVVARRSAEQSAEPEP